MGLEGLDPPLNYDERGETNGGGPKTSGNVVIDSLLNGLLLEASDFGKTLIGSHMLGGPCIWRHIDGAH